MENGVKDLAEIFMCSATFIFVSILLIKLPGLLFLWPSLMFSYTVVIFWPLLTTIPLT